MKRSPTFTFVLRKYTDEDGPSFASIAAMYEALDKPYVATFSWVDAEGKDCATTILAASRSDLLDGIRHLLLTVLPE